VKRQKLALWKVEKEGFARRRQTLNALRSALNAPGY